MSYYKEIRERAYKAASAASLQDVVATYYHGRFNKMGKTLYMECPNPSCPSHHSKSIDKCGITFSKNLFHCYACNTKGSAIGMYSLLTGIPFNDAVIDLALMTGGITAQERDKVKGGKKSTANEKLPTLSTKKIVVNNKSYKKRDDYVLDLVYSTLLELNEFELDVDARNHLLNERHLSEEELVKNRFFSYKKDFNIEELIEKIKIKNPNFDPKFFAGVPGFFFKYKDSTRKYGYWCFVKPLQNCLFGQPCLNAKGQIIGLQMRKKSKGYFWISSEKINEYDTCDFGTSSGSPIHVEIPNLKTSNDIFVTEGKFKAIALSKSSNRISLSVQGVRNYVHIPEVLEQLNNTGKVYIAFDADFMCKKDVYACVQGLGNLLSAKGIPNYVVMWDISMGKGFDDFYYDNPLTWKQSVNIVSTDKLIEACEHHKTDKNNTFEIERTQVYSELGIAM